MTSLARGSPWALVLFLLSATWSKSVSADSSEDDREHWAHLHPMLEKRLGSTKQLDSDHWTSDAQNILKHKLEKPLLKGKAKNVIMFLGDGMSIPTLTAARIYLGQSQEHTGEESVLSFEKFPYAGFSKTYCVDRQVADSACSATAYLGGVKANMGTIGVTARVKVNDCAGMKNVSNQVTSILQWSQDVGKATGVVTTTRITHASPAGTYAYIANRDWENDAQITSSKQNSAACDDIAEQLIRNNPGKNVQVILGGGRKQFRSKSATDEEGTRGSRTDNADLIAEWKADKKNRRANYKYVWNKQQLLAVDTNKTEFLLGLFNRDHLPYRMHDSSGVVPSLEEMTRVAIRTLSKDPEGYFLFIEGGRIDHAHHSTKAHLALDETVEFSKAIQAAVDITDEDETLIVVTADHAHTMSFSGYPKRGNSIFGIAGISGIDGLPYATLNYANGKGYNPRYDLSKDNMRDANYRFPATAPLSSETHGGDDVAVFARGPWSHLFSGSFEQNYIPHAMAYASCVGSGYTLCKEKQLLT
ncbi:membrane-bound alkaline phosphatase-like [Periplaneta americana]|uniref:membrane-bound alkaline phosphatase-like n=1 Tax=Periplaneta americana TaxID=6978 RepID=UPI0037E7EC9A